MVIEVVRSILALLTRICIRRIVLPLGALKIWGKCTPKILNPVTQ